MKKEFSFMTTNYFGAMAIHFMNVWNVLHQIKRTHETKETNKNIKTETEWIQKNLIKRFTYTLKAIEKSQ